MKVNRLNKNIYILKLLLLLVSALTISCSQSNIWDKANSSSLIGLLFGQPPGFVAVGQNGTAWISPDGSDGSWTETGPGGSDLTAITYGNGLFVATGFSGQIWISPNGSEGSWTDVSPSPGGDNILGVAYGNNRFVAVGENGTIWQSVDGSAETWNNVGVGGDTLSDITYINGRFVAVGTNLAAWWSTDGAVWNNSGPGGVGVFTGIAHGSDRFVAVGAGGITRWSIDGTQQSWISAPVGGGGTLDIAYGNGRFVVVGLGGDVYWSSTGNAGSWTLAGPVGVNDLVGVTYGNGHFVAVGVSGTMWRSPNGSSGSWEEVSPDPGGANIAGIAFREERTTTPPPPRFVAVGFGSGEVWRSPDGSMNSWSPSGPVGTNLYGVTFGNGRYVAVGTGGNIYSSPDGSFGSWNNVVVGGAQIWEIAYGNGTYVAVDNNGDVYWSTTGLAVLGDWNLTDPNGGATDALREVVYGDGRFVVVGANGSVYHTTGPPGWVWTDASIVTGNTFVSAAFNRDTFIIAGTGGSAHRRASDFSGGWLDISPFLSSFFAMTYGSNRYVMVGVGGSVYWADDPLAAADWNAVTALGTNLDGLVYGNGVFVTVGDSTGPTSECWYSTDGTDGSWVNASIPSPSGMNDITYNTGEGP